MQGIESKLGFGTKNRLEKESPQNQISRTYMGVLMSLGRQVR